jgi:hypothetical protein
MTREEFTAVLIISFITPFPVRAWYVYTVYTHSLLLFISCDPVSRLVYVILGSCSIYFMR